MRVIVDANVILRLMIPEKKSYHQHLKARDFWQKINDNQVEAFLSIAVIQEVLWVAERVYQLERKTYILDLVRLCEHANVKLLEMSKKTFFSLLFEFKKNSVDFVDIYLSTIAKSKKMQVASFDQDLKKLGAPLYRWD